MKKKKEPNKIRKKTNGSFKEHRLFYQQYIENEKRETSFETEKKQAFS